VKEAEERVLRGKEKRRGNAPKVSRALNEGLNEKRA